MSVGLPATPRLAHRLSWVRAALADRALDALLVTSPHNLRYLFNHVGTAGVGLVLPDGVELFVDGRYREAVRARQASEAACPNLHVELVTGRYEAAVARRLERFSATARVGFEASHVSVATWSSWCRLAPSAGARLRETDGLVEAARAVKDDFELACLRRSAAGLRGVAEAAFAAVAPGTTEAEVAGAVEAALRAGGFDRPAFDTIVASGPNAALPHHRAGLRRLALGDLVVLDFGGVLDGYCSDLTRTVSVGWPDEEARRVHAAVLASLEAALAAVRPGVACSDVDRAARQVLESHGLGDAFAHSTGHGLGLDVHEAPRLARTTTDVGESGSEPSGLVAGMVVTVEPGAYIAGWGGVRIEDDVLVTDAGHEVLTSAPRDLRPCGV
jgi:Xaa-Pro aminopeptidase